MHGQLNNMTANVAYKQISCCSKAVLYTSVRLVL